MTFQSKTKKDNNRASNTSRVQAVAYYRNSAGDSWQYAVSIQRNCVQQWAREHGIDIVQEFIDNEMPCFPVEERSAFIEMMEKWIKQREDFMYVLCMNITRLGRFHAIDIIAECKRYGKKLVCTASE